MPFSIPTIGDLAERTRQSFRANLKGTDAAIWPNNVYASAKVIAGMVFEAFGFMAYVSRMIFAHTAPDIETLLMHGAEYGIDRKPAAPASGFVTFTSAGVLTVDGAAVLRRSDGFLYVVSGGGGLIAPGVLQIGVVAAADGILGNAVAGTSLEIVSGVVADGEVTVAVGPGNLVMGADVEGIEEYRSRILFRKRNPPHGGAASDYVMWALQVSGVTRVFVERLWNGPGTVRVYVMMDGSFPNGIPDAAAIARVQLYIDTVAPAGAIVKVAAPVAVPIDVYISNLAPNTTDVQNAVRAEIADTFFRLARVSGIDTAHGGMPFLAVPETLWRSWLWQAVSNATGERRHVITLPAIDITIPTGGIAVPAGVVFI